MSADTVINYFQSLGFEETEIEDGLTALGIEYEQAGSYALITDDEGNLPESLDQFLIFAAYSAEGAYQWSVGFKNAAIFKAIWDKGDSISQKVEAVRQYGENKGVE